MTTTANADPHHAARAAIGAHFAGRASPAAEAALRAHLPSCADCRDCYRRHHLLAGLDPSAPSAEERIARGLGFARRAPARARWLAWGLPLVGAVAAAVVFVSAPSARAPGDHVAGAMEAPVARGAATTAAPAARLFIYRFGADGARFSAAGATARAPELVDRSMRGHDELAFAYTNPTGRRYVAIFGVDESRRVYWFHPAWPAGAPAPRAIAAAAGPEPHELPEAIRHEIAGRRLTIRAAFADRPLAVEEIEAAVGSGADSGALAARLGTDVFVTERVLDVRP
ncbi:MAG TPA: zf-HC2 domain-containing protein [Polyangia bacterium]|jgi:hypothetical protein